MASEPAFLGVEKSACGRRWISRAADDRSALAIAQRHGLPDAVARLLAARGVAIDEVGDFLEPTLRRFLPDPSHLKDMDAAIARLAGAVTRGERIAVYGDYDVDGATSSALLLRFFRGVGADIVAYIPDRLTEGYGPNAAALLKLKAQGVAVAVTVDCGITAFAPLDAAAEAGLDVIVIDHHVAEPLLPRAVAVVDPNRLDETSPHRQMAAVGVAFLLIVGVNRALRVAGRYGANRPEPDLRQWLDLVALGTVCDVVPLTGVNRAFVRQGLRVMRERGNAGLVALAEVARMNEAPGTFHAGFLLGPRVNAGGRVGQADLGTRLLSTDDPHEAGALALRLDQFNAERRAIEQAVLDAALARIGEPPVLPPAIVVMDDGWHPGVIGIVASRLVERFHRPVFVIGYDGDVGKGSGRSVRGVDLGSIVIAARQSGLLINGGGHAMAAGLTVARSMAEAFADFMVERVAAQMPNGALVPSLSLDGAVAASGLTLDFLRTLERCAPFGVGNPEPRFALSSMVVSWWQGVGENHVRCQLTGSDGARVNAIAFRAGGRPLGDALTNTAGAPLHIAGVARVNRWNGREDVQFQIEDAALAR
ncbi:MAG: single-stranded-DNA-specific exonuclease RecJ [Alphaproteobacteria bacterium]|nr:single-stranded-DNA-specific exonuclease RecJ [Alphaproteobacteria bacterium]MCW5739619.1 single-stranded-DNA-specific exonuclease RecJ [Alphaproteobacteria bacterium]